MSALERMPPGPLQRMPLPGVPTMITGTDSARRQLARLRDLAARRGANLSDPQRRHILAALEDIESLAREMCAIISASG